jgi:hypothetical protein
VNPADAKLSDLRVPAGDACNNVARPTAFLTGLSTERESPRVTHLTETVV